MIRTTLRSLLQAAILPAAIVALAVGQSRAATVNSSITLGVPGNIGTFSASIGPGSASNIVIGSVLGNYKSHTAISNTNIAISAGAQTPTLTVGSATISSSKATGAANLDYDNFTPGTPQFLNSFSSNLSDGAVSTTEVISGNVSTKLNATILGIPTSSTVNLGLTFNGIIKNIMFTSTSGVADPGSYNIPGTFSATIGGVVDGTIPITIGSINLGNIPIPGLVTIADTPVSFPGSLLGLTSLSDTGNPFGGGLTTVNKNDMLAQFFLNLPSAVPIALSLPLNTSITNSVPTTSSGLTTLNITGSTLNLNLSLNNVNYDLRGVVPNTLVPEPSSLALGSLALVGLIGVAIKRRKAAR